MKKYNSIANSHSSHPKFSWFRYCQVRTEAMLVCKSELVVRFESKMVIMYPYICACIIIMNTQTPLRTSLFTREHAHAHCRHLRAHKNRKKSTIPNSQKMASTSHHPAKFSRFHQSLHLFHCHQRIITVVSFVG